MQVDVDGFGQLTVASTVDHEIHVDLPSLRRSGTGDSTWFLALWPNEARRLAIALLTAAQEADPS